MNTVCSMLVSSLRTQSQLSCFAVFRLLLSSSSTFAPMFVFFVTAICQCRQLNSFECDSSDLHYVHVFEIAFSLINRSNRTQCTSNNKNTTRSHSKKQLIILLKKNGTMNTLHVLIWMTVCEYHTYDMKMKM